MMQSVNCDYKIKRVTILNSKGGCGKTLIASNLASIYAANGHKTTLIDYDPQGTGTHWLKQRPENFPSIHGINATKKIKQGVTRSWQLQVPAGTERMIIDTPAGVRGMDLNEFASNTDYLIIPIVPSDGDIHAALHLIADLLLNVKIRTLNVKVGVVANRVKKNTKILSQLNRFLEKVKFPFITNFRDTQNYVAAAKQGLGIHELYPPSLVKLDVADWDALVNFIELKWNYKHNEILKENILANQSIQH